MRKHTQFISISVSLTGLAVSVVPTQSYADPKWLSFTTGLVRGYRTTPGPHHKIPRLVMRPAAVHAPWPKDPHEPRISMQAIDARAHLKRLPMAGPLGFPELPIFTQPSLTPEQSYHQFLKEWNAAWADDNRGLAEKILTENGSVHLNHLDSRGNALLHTAAQQGQREQIQFLIEHRINLNSQNRHGQTALHIAVNQNDILLIALLSENNASFTIQDLNGATPICGAIERNDLPLFNFISSLHPLSEQIKQTQPDALIRSALSLQLAGLTSKKAWIKYTHYKVILLKLLGIQAFDLNHIMQDGLTPLRWVVRQKWALPHIEELLQMGAKIRLENHANHHSLLMKEALENLPEGEEPKIHQLLVDYGG